MNAVEMKNGNSNIFIIGSTILGVFGVFVPVVAMVFWVSSTVSSMDTRTSVNEKHIDQLLEFKNMGDRFTQSDGAIMSNRIKVLETETRTLPTLIEVINDLKKEIKALQLELKELKTELKFLQTELRIKQ